METKYKLTDETITVNGRILHRIKALKDFRNVKKGDKGGFVETEDNLSHNRNCWISENAKAFGEARVYGNAKISGNAIVYNNAMVGGDAEIRGSAKVCDTAYVSGNALVCGHAHVGGHAQLYGNAYICGDACVCNDASVLGNTLVCGHAHVGGCSTVYGEAQVCGDAIIKSMSDYIVFKNWWSSGRYFTWTRSNNKWKAGCFYGTGKDLIAKAYKDSELSGREYERVVRYVESILNEDRI